MPRLKLAIARLIAYVGVVRTTTTNAEEYNMMMSELEAMANALQGYLGELALDDPGTNPMCTGITMAIDVQMAHIRSQQNRGYAKRVFLSTQDRDDIIQQYRQIQSLFRRLLSNVSIQNLESVKKERVANLMRELAPLTVDEARYNSSTSITIERRGCTKQTREHIQTTLQDWAQNPDGARIYWMNGMAGTGKTTIAYSLCEWLEANGRLGASFFCSRVSSQCQRVDLIIPTIAYDLAQYSAAFRAALAKVLESDSGAAKLAVAQQFKKLVQAPILATKSSMPTGAVIVIDALDECGNDNSVEVLIKVLLESDVDRLLKFFVTSRPEPLICKEMLSSSVCSPTVLHLHEQSTVEEDIKKYLTEALSVMSPPPSEDQIRQLTKLSGKLFIYAATVVRYILPGKAAADSMGRLMTILSPNVLQTGSRPSNKLYKSLDDLYLAILIAALEGLEEGEAETMRLVLWTAICVKEPMSIPTLSRFLSLDERQVTSVLQELRSVLHVSDGTRLVSALHASFPDYMLDQSRSGSLCYDQTSHQYFLAGQCFVVMREQLRFNICRLESSCMFDEDVEDLGQRIKRYISPELYYACQYWEEHLCKAGASYFLHDHLVDFLKLRMLFWLEVLNLTRCNTVDRTRSLLRVRHWLSEFAFPTETQQLVTDIYSFMTQFLITQCGRSTPHIYVSALSFCPESSSVYDHYWGRTRGLEGAIASHESMDPPATWRTNDLVTSLRFSVDGTRIVHGNICGTTYIRDAYTGDILAGPFHEFAREVCSVSLTPDSARLIICVDNRIVRVRGVHNGRIEAEPLNEEYHDQAGPVVVSPDAAYIATGWKDFSVRLWDTYTGSAISKPLEGHTKRISSIEFSHDNRYIASGSADATIRVWGVSRSTGEWELVAGPFQGHVRSVSSVSLSPDGKYVASGSADETVRVWDATTGKCTIISYERGVPSVAFSPNGAFIAAGSDGTITIWDAHTRGIVAGPVQVGSHIGLVRTVAFSPDNRRLAYSSTDAIRVWDWQLDAENIPSTKDNWFTDNNRPLLCVPKRRYSCQTPHRYGTLLTDSRGTILVNYQKLDLGERWTECFVS